MGYGVRSDRPDRPAARQRTKPSVFAGGNRPRVRRVEQRSWSGSWSTTIGWIVWSGAGRFAPARRAAFALDGEVVFETAVAPRGRLGLVIWIDNQFAAWRPDGSVATGLLAGPGAALEIEDLQVRPGAVV